MYGTGNVTPDRVAPSDPTIEAMLMMMLSAGKSENMKTPNACVATMNRAVARLTGRKPVPNGRPAMPNMTKLPSMPIAIKIAV